MRHVEWADLSAHPDQGQNDTGNRDVRPGSEALFVSSKRRGNMDTTDRYPGRDYLTNWLIRRLSVSSACSTPGTAPGRSSAIRPRPHCRAGRAVQPDCRGGCLEPGSTLRQQAGDHAGQHVAAARRREVGRRVGIDRRPAVGRGDHRVGCPSAPRRRRLSAAAARARSSFGPVWSKSRENSPSCGVITTGALRSAIALNSRPGAAEKLVSASASSTTPAALLSAASAFARVASPTPLAGPTTTALARGSESRRCEPVGSVDACAA